MNTKSVIERKLTDTNSLLDVDENKRCVKMCIASMGDVDRDDDVFDSKAFDNTIRMKGPKGSNEVWHLLDHGGGIKSAALSKFKELYVEGNMLVGVSPYRDTFNWKDVAWPLYKGKDITQHSVGFSTVNSVNETKDGKAIRVITEASLWEGSAVLWGANPNTPTLDVVKSWLTDVERRTKAPIGDRFNKIYKSIKDGEFSKENISLLKIELKYLEQEFLELEEKASKSGEDPTKTANDQELNRVFEAINNFNNHFKK